MRWPVEPRFEVEEVSPNAATSSWWQASSGLGCVVENPRKLGNYPMHPLSLSSRRAHSRLKVRERNGTVGKKKNCSRSNAFHHESLTKLGNQYRNSSFSCLKIPEKAAAGASASALSQLPMMPKFHESLRTYYHCDTLSNNPSHMYQNDILKIKIS